MKKQEAIDFLASDIGKALVRDWLARIGELREEAVVSSLAGHDSLAHEAAARSQELGERVLKIFEVAESPHRMEVPPRLVALGDRKGAAPNGSSLPVPARPRAEVH